jgi:hypothetical protein
LETQAEAERTSIFEEEAASLFDVFGECGLNQIGLAQIAVTRIVLNAIAFAVSRGRHRRPFGCILMLAQILPQAHPIAPGASDD